MDTDHTPNTAVPTASPPPAPHRLLILGCSKAKTTHDGLVPAIERYDGPPFRVLRRYLRQRFDPALRIFILSAEYGIVASDAPIPAYDRLMTPFRARELRHQVAATLTHLLNGSDILPDNPHRALLVLGKNYRDALTDDAGNASDWLLGRCVSGCPGQRLTQLKKLAAHGVAKMNAASYQIGTVVSDDDSPTFEIVRVKLKFGCDAKPGTLIRIPVQRGPEMVTLLGRVRSAVEHNPHEEPQSINVRETLNMVANYPTEEVSTSIYRLIEADLIEQIVDGQLSSPQTLPKSGAEVFEATEDEIVNALGLVDLEDATGLAIGTTVSGTPVDIRLRRDSIQRHYFICGTTGSGKSYAMGVIAEELIKQGLPVIFLDTQDEYSSFVAMKGGAIVTPGADFTIRLSSLTETELIDLSPSLTPVHRDIVGRAFIELEQELKSGKRLKFNIDDLLTQVADVGKFITFDPKAIELAKSRLSSLRREPIFGEGLDEEDWRKSMYPCMAINCKKLTASRLQSVATAVLRELQNLRLAGHIPPYVAVIDEAHLFVPDGEGSACKQIIREGVRIGRHHGIAMVLMTQSPVDIDKRTIRQCNTRLVFALEPDQLDAIRGVRADASEELLRSLPKLPRGTCLLSGTYESVRHAIPIKIRQRETKNSEGGKTPDIFKEMAENWKPKIEAYSDRYGAPTGQ